MGEDLRQHIMKIKEIAPKLNAVMDSANKSVAELEATLRSCGIGIEVRMYFDCSADELTDYFVGYQRSKSGRGFCFVIDEVRVIERSESHEVPDTTEIVDSWDWQDAPRDLRLKSLKEITEIVSEISNDAEELLQKSSASVESLNLLKESLLGNSVPQPEILAEDGDEFIVRSPLDRPMRIPKSKLRK